MKTILLLLLFPTVGFAVCSNITRTNMGPRTVLSAAIYNADLNTVYTRVNALPGDCITDETVTSAKILNGTIVAADIANGAITPAKTSGSNYSVSSSSGSFTTASTSFVDVTNQTVTITTNGRPVEFIFVTGNILVTDSSNPMTGFILKLMRGVSEVEEVELLFNPGATGSVNQQNYLPARMFGFYDAQPAGTYTYKIQARAAPGLSSTVSILDARIMAREL